MSRKEELEKIVYKAGSDNRVKAAQLIEEIIFLEGKMQEYKSMDFWEVHPKFPDRKRPSAAAKQYDKSFQLYQNALRLLFRITGDMGENDEESPLRKWVKSREDLSD